MFDLCVIGHVTRDHIVLRNAPPKIQPGGTAYYASVAAARLGLRTAAVTRLHPDDRSVLLAGMEASGITLHTVDSPTTTAFVNTVTGADLNERRQKVLAVALPFQPEDIDVEARVYLFGPLTSAELTPACLGRACGGIVAMDVQGLLRHVHGTLVHPIRPQDAMEMLAGVDIVKASIDEALLLTGTAYACEAASVLHDAGPAEVVVTMGSAGSIVYAGGRRAMIPAVAPPKVVDTTGCGDTYLTAYVAHRLRGHSPEESGHFASHVAGAKTAYHGAFRGEVIPQNISA